MGSGASSSSSADILRIELEKPPNASDITPDEALAEVQRLRALLAEHVKVVSPPPLVICGPSGVGKGTLLHKLMEAMPGVFKFSVSHTTRGPRPGEEDGKDYNFTSVDDIKERIEKGEFLEYAEVHGNYYGTSFAALKADKQIVILDIDVQGVEKVKQAVIDGKLGGAKYIFISPKDLEALEARLRGRGTETEEAIQKRTANARGEMEYSEVEGNFNDIVVNDDLERAQEDFVAAVKSIYNM